VPNNRLSEKKNQMMRAPDLDQVKPLSSADSTCLKEVAEVLERHAAIDRFGITLLHDHFDLRPGEVLVETCDPEQRVLTTAPTTIPAEDDNWRLVETSWRFEPDASPTPTLVCRVGCFVDLQDRHKRTHDRVWKTAKSDPVSEER